MIKNNILETLMLYIQQPEINKLIINNPNILSPEYIVRLNKFFKIKFIFKNPITKTNYLLKKEIQIKKLCCKYNSLEEKVLSVLKYASKNIEAYFDLKEVKEIYIYDCCITTPTVDEINNRLKYSSFSVLSYLLNLQKDLKIEPIPYTVKKRIKNFLKNKNYQNKLYPFSYVKDKYFFVYNKNKRKYLLILNDKECIKRLPAHVHTEIKNHFGTE